MLKFLQKKHYIGENVGCIAPLQAAHKKTLLNQFNTRNNPYKSIVLRCFYSPVGLIPRPSGAFLAS
jgi:hypothetical protein